MPNTKIWILALTIDGEINTSIFLTEAEAKARADVFYKALWGDEGFEGDYPGYAEAHSLFQGESVLDSNLVWIEAHDLPEDPNVAFEAVYNFEDLAGQIDGYDPALHQQALHEWVTSQRRGIHDAMSDAVFDDFSFDVETLMDPGAYWRWDHQTPDYTTWAAEQRKCL